jgi:hypothetical protein
VPGDAPLEGPNNLPQLLRDRRVIDSEALSTLMIMRGLEHLGSQPLMYSVLCERLAPRGVTWEVSEEKTGATSHALKKGAGYLDLPPQCIPVTKRSQ